MQNKRQKKVNLKNVPTKKIYWQQAIIPKTYIQVIILLLFSWKLFFKIEVMSFFYLMKSFLKKKKQKKVIISACCKIGLEREVC